MAFEDMGFDVEVKAPDPALASIHRLMDYIEWRKAGGDPVELFFESGTAGRWKNPGSESAG